MTTEAYLAVGAILFAAGAFGSLRRTRLAARLVGVELMLAAAALTFVSAAAAFRELEGQAAALVVAGVALAQAVAVGASLAAEGATE